MMARIPISRPELCHPTQSVFAIGGFEPLSALTWKIVAASVLGVLDVWDIWTSTPRLTYKSPLVVCDQIDIHILLELLRCCGSDLRFRCLVETSEVTSLS